MQPPHTRGIPVIPAFAEPNGTPGGFYINGVTRDATGNALAGCWVKLFETLTDIQRQATTSDATGNYSFVVPDSTTLYYAEAYLPGSPDVAGTTKNNLVGA